jgi:predicted dinucleotide-binding enzyme
LRQAGEANLRGKIVIDVSNPLVNPSVVPGDHNLFVCGNDVAAKAKVAQFIAENFGWKRDNIVDLGDISNSRGTEMYPALWIRLWGKLGTPHFNIHIVRA